MMAESPNKRKKRVRFERTPDDNMVGIIQAFSTLCASGSKFKRPKKRPASPYLPVVSDQSEAADEDKESEPPAKKTSREESAIPSTSSQSSASTSQSSASTSQSSASTSQSSASTSQSSASTSQSSASTSRQSSCLSERSSVSSDDSPASGYLNQEFWGKCQDSYLDEVKRVLGEDFNPDNVSAGMEGVHREFSEQAILRLLKLYRKLINLKVFMETYPYKSITVQAFGRSLDIVDATDEQIEEEFEKLDAEFPDADTKAPLKSATEGEERLEMLWKRAYTIATLGLYVCGRIMKIPYEIGMATTRLRMSMKFTECLFEMAVTMRRQSAYLMKDWKGMVKIESITYIAKVNAQIGIISYKMLDEVNTLNLYLHNKCQDESDDED